MKTFDEAMDLMKASEFDPKDIERAHDLAVKHSGVAKEVANSPKTKSLIKALEGAFGYGPEPCDCEGCIERHAMMVTAFLNGLRVGMEMERQELPTT